MAGSINKVILVGNLGKDPDIRTMQNGARVANLSIATSETWKDKNSGERKERTEWHRVVVFNENLIKLCENYLRKGNKLYIEGQIETRKYEKDGKDVYTTEVVLKQYRGEITILDSKGGGGGSSAMADDDMGAGSGSGSAPSISDMDDEIPF